MIYVCANPLVAELLSICTSHRVANDNGKGNDTRVLNDDNREQLRERRGEFSKSNKAHSAVGITGTRSVHPPLMMQMCTTRRTHFRIKA